MFLTIGAIVLVFLFVLFRDYAVRGEAHVLARAFGHLCGFLAVLLIIVRCKGVM